MTATSPYLENLLLNFDPCLINPCKKSGGFEGDFIQMIAHDLRAPLTNLRMFLELTRAGHYRQGEEQFDKRVSQLIPELSRINRLLDELLDFQRIEAGRFSLEKRAVAASILANTAIAAVLHCAEVKGIRIVNECSDLELMVDADRITQVIINLLQNAIKFSPSNSTIWIRTKLKDGMLEFSVIDEGKGVALPESKKIFERFTQACIHERKNGYGLGLAVSSAIVHQHGGEIGVHSQTQGIGGHFWFALSVETNSATHGSEGLLSPVIASS